VGPRTGLDNVEKIKLLTLAGLELRPLGRPARSQSLYPLRYFCRICNSTNDYKNSGFVCSVAEEELDEFNIHVARHRPEELTKLAKTTKFSRKEIQLIYRGFKQVRIALLITRQNLSKLHLKSLI
jgi:hypothetical protein